MSFGRWVLNTADSVSRVSDGVDHAELLGRRALSGTRDAFVGAAEVHRVGVTDRFALHHSDDDKERALAALDQAFSAFRADVEPRASAMDAYPARAQWWQADVLPILSDWSLFRDHQSSSWTNRLATEWSTYVAWITQLRLLRAEARMQGLVLASAEPTSLPETVFDRGVLGKGSRLETAWTLGKVVLYTAVGVAGVASLWAVYREVTRRDEDTPSEGGQGTHE